VSATVSGPLTQQGTILGTLQYISPEQVQGKEADARSDIFSFGAVVYEMATGSRAFDGDSPATILAAILDHEPPPLSVKQPAAPRALDRVIRTCLAKDPDDRWQSASDLMRELRWNHGGRLAPDAAQSHTSKAMGLGGHLGCCSRSGCGWYDVVWQSTPGFARSSALRDRDTADNGPCFIGHLAGWTITRIRGNL
jgi:serine/threonine protein kinase